MSTTHPLESLEGPFEALLALTLVAACAAAAYPLAASVTQRRLVSHRWCAAAIIASWLLTSLFYALAAISAFRLHIVLPILLVLAGYVQLTVGRRPDVRGLFESDVRLALEHIRRPPGMLVSLCSLAVAVVFVLRIMKGLVAPPLAWDALTYHLVRAARWVQHGGWAPDAAPDAWRYYEYFPPGGNVLWAWAMLPSHSDALVAVAGGLVWLVGLLAAYGAARALRASRRAGLTTALALAAMPCVLGFVTSAYVTGVVLADLLLALTFVLLAIESGQIGDVWLAAAALGLAAGVQALALPLLALGLTVLIVARWRHHGASTLLWTSAMSLLACMPMLTGYFVAWKDTGSPLYPLPLTIAGKTILPGNEQLAGVFSGAHLSQLPPFAVSTFVLDLFHRKGTIDHLNFGAGAIALVILGVSGLWPMLTDRRRRAGVIPLLAVVAVPIAGIMSDAMLSQRTAFAPIAGRLIAPSLAALALVGSIVRGPLADWLRALAVLVGVAYAMPRTVSDVELTAMARVAPYIGGGVAIAIVAGAIGWSIHRRTRMLSVGVLLGLLLIAFGVGSTRSAFRYRIYAAAAAPTGAPYDLTPLAPYLAAWQIWEGLDGGQPKRIAFAAAWDGFNGHTSYRYPLLGSDLQNSVVYVPATRDGEVIDYKDLDQLLPRLDFRAWLRRLVEQRIAVVVVSVPGVPELDWMRRHPTAFVPFSEGLEGTWTWAFRVIESEAEALLSAMTQ